jgi:hypothetical protein
MPNLRSRRICALLTIGALGAGTAVAAAPAQAGLLDGVVGTVGTLVTGTGATLGGVVNGVLPGTGGVITGVTGTVGGVINGVGGTVSGVVDQTLGGVLGGGSGLLPDDVLGSLLGTLLSNSSTVPGAANSIVLSGGTVGPGGQILLDASAPRSTVTVLTKLKQVGKTGKMKIRIKTNEPGIVAVKSALRPGTAIKAKPGQKAVKVSKKLIKIPQIVLGYRKAGQLDVTVRVSRAAQRTLGKVKAAKMSVGTIAVDVWKNQDSESTKLNLKR